MLLFIFLFSFVSADSVLSPVLNPEIYVDGVSEEICEAFPVHPKIYGAFYLNLDALVGCWEEEYEIKISVKKSGFLFDTTLYSDTIFSSCNYWDLEDDALAPLKVSFSRELSTTLNNIFELDSSNYDIYFEAKVIDGPGDFEYDFNQGHIVSTEYYDFFMIDCGECIFGNCCVDGVLLPAGSQPDNIEDEYYCSGDNSVFGVSYVNKKDYYCDGRHQDYSYTIERQISECGNCEFCSGEDSTCSSYSSSTIFSLSDCDYLDNECRDYADVENTCDGWGGVNFVGCVVYDDLSAGTSCSGGVCDGDGHCVEEFCVPKFSKRCAYGNLYWEDSCGNLGSVSEYCDFGCDEENLICRDEPSIVCDDDYDCGYHDPYLICTSDINTIPYNAIVEVRDFTLCKNPGSYYSYCLDRGEDYILVGVCGDRERCDGGNCVALDWECWADEECGTNVDELVCLGKDVYRRVVEFNCLSEGMPRSRCINSSSMTLVQECKHQCKYAACHLEDFDFSKKLTPENRRVRNISNMT